MALHSSSHTAEGRLHRHRPQKTRARWLILAAGVVACAVSVALLLLLTTRSPDLAGSLSHWQENSTGWIVEPYSDETHEQALIGSGGSDALILDRTLVTPTRLSLRVYLPPEGRATVAIMHRGEEWYALRWELDNVESRYECTIRQETRQVHAEERADLNWHTWELQVFGDQVVLHIDGILAGHSQFPEGDKLNEFTVGLHVGATGLAQFRDIRSTKI